MNRPHDPNVTTDVPTRRADSLGADPSGAAAGDLPDVPGYKVLRELARGGMGRVLAAFDLTLDRDVAVKVLLPGAKGDRFVRESKITARLPHPAIPPVHALGTLADGSPFLAMKLVEGRTLAAELKTADRPRLLQVFTQVCEAVAYAHSRGVIHRDLKPANVMVGAFGEVQVMDWGLAKEMRSAECGVRIEDDSDNPHSAFRIPQSDDADRTTAHNGVGESTEEETQAGTVLGTPAYMAPEVASGHGATTAADVYGLGAILHALLTGRPPYAGANAADVLKQVTTTDPALFGEANSSVPPLVAVCRKAMARDPAARYASAEDVAADVRRWLADEPVSVYREPWTGRAARWARGRGATNMVAAGVLLLVLVIASTATAGVFWRGEQQTKKEQQETKKEWVRAEEEKVKATENADAAITVVRDLNGYIKLIELSENRQSVTDQQRKRALDHTVLSYERLLKLLPDDEQLRSTLALTHRFRANLCRLLNEKAEAEKSYREASRHYSELAAAHPRESDYRKDLALTARDYALFVKTLGRLKEATEILAGSIRLYEELWRAAPNVASNTRLLAMMLLDRADVDYQLGELSDTERLARRSTELYARLADEADARPEPLDAMFRGSAETRLAIALRELGRVDDALVIHDRVVERLAGVAGLSATRDNLFEYHRAQAERAWTSARVPGRQAAGVAELDSAIAGFEKLSKQFPQAPVYLRSQGMGTLYRGRFKALLGQRTAAAQDLHAAAKIFEGLVGKHPDIPVYRSFLGQTYTALGQLDTDPARAIEWYRKAREMLNSALQRSPENAQDRKALTELGALTKGPKP